MKESLLESMCVEPFTVTAYLKRKATIMLNLETEPSAKASKEKKERSERSRVVSDKVKVDVPDVPTDILHPKLYRSLMEWRAEKMREIKLPAYIIMRQKALMGIVNLLPSTPAALESVPYFGAKSVEKYGLEILSMVRKYMKEHQLKGVD